jgi:hypothetical protein
MPTIYDMARARHLPEVSVSTFELLRVASGSPMIVVTATGDAVLLRLATPEELLARHADACQRMGVAPSMTYAQAEDLTRPAAV